MAVALRATGSATNGASATAISPAWNVVPTNGDLLIAVIGMISQTAVTAPSGWTLLGQQDTGTQIRMQAYWRIAASEPASNTWTLAGATKCYGWCGAYSGADTAAPVLSSSSPGPGTAITTPTVTVPVNGWLATAVTGRHANTGSLTTWTSSDGSDAERLDFASNVAGSNDISCVITDSNRALTGGSASRVLTASQAESQTGAMSIAFGPPAADPPPLGSAAGARWGVHV